MSIINPGKKWWFECDQCGRRKLTVDPGELPPRVAAHGAWKMSYPRDWIIDLPSDPQRILHFCCEACRRRYWLTAEKAPAYQVFETWYPFGAPS